MLWLTEAAECQCPGEIFRDSRRYAHHFDQSLLKGLKLLMDAYNSLSPVMKGFVAGIVIAIPIIGTVTTAVITLTAAYHALQVAMNPVAGIIGIAVGALSALGFGLAAASMKTEEVTTAQRSMKDEIKDAERQVLGRSREVQSPC
jgi:hypothetical protein